MRKYNHAMAQQVYPPSVIVRVILDHFFKYRKLTLTTRGLSQESEVPVFTTDRVISDMEQFYYVRLDALRENPRGTRDWVVILVLSMEGKFSNHGPDMRKLLDGIEAERATKEGRLDEVIVVAEEAFFGKKHVTDVIREFQQKQPTGPDFDGTSAFFSAYPYYNFCLVVPEHKSVAVHRIMTPEEVASVLESQRLARTDLAVIYTTDAPIVWNGAREGQVIEIKRDSQTAGSALCYRRVERGAI